MTRFATRPIAIAALVTVSLVSIVALTAAQAAASTIHISGSGLWAANAPTTPCSSAGKAFTFSFNLNETYAFTDYGTIKVIDPSQIHGVHYSLDGAPLKTSTFSAAPPNCAGATGTLCGIEIVSSAGGGGLTLDFADWSVDFFGVNNVDVGSNGKLKRGDYSFIPNINGDPSLRDGHLNEGNGPTLASIVPEPATWMMMSLGLGALGAAVRGRRFASLAA